MQYHSISSIHLITNQIYLLIPKKQYPLQHKYNHYTIIKQNTQTSIHPIPSTKPNPNLIIPQFLQKTKYTSKKTQQHTTYKSLINT